MQDLSLPEGRAQAARALHILACNASEDFKTTLSYAALPSLISVMHEAAIPQGRVAAAACIAELAQVTVLRRKIIVAALPALVALLQDSANSEGRAEAAQALRNLSYTANKHLHFSIAAAAMPYLTNLLQSTDTPNGRAHAAAALHLLADNAMLQVPIAFAAMPALATLLQNNEADISGKYAAASAIETLSTIFVSEVDITHKRLVRLQFAKSGDLSI